MFDNADQATAYVDRLVTDAADNARRALEMQGGHGAPTGRAAGARRDTVGG